MPVRTRVFTVPSGSLKRSASSDCVRPGKYACSISSRCSGGSASSARATARCCSLSAARVSGLSTGGGSGAASDGAQRARCSRAADRSRGCARCAPATPPATRARRCRFRRASRPARTPPAAPLPPRCDRAGFAGSARTAGGCGDRTARRPPCCRARRSRSSSAMSRAGVFRGILLHAAAVRSASIRQATQRVGDLVGRSAGWRCSSTCENGAVRVGIGHAHAPAHRARRIALP